ncbi:MAG: cellulase family glycosylhydrolase [bacterium]
MRGCWNIRDAGGVTRAVGTSLCVALAVGSAGCDEESPCTLPADVAPATLRLTLDGAKLRDANGREVLLRGVNAGGRSKLFPFFPFPFVESGHPDQAGAPPFEAAAAEYFDRIRAWGHNVVRLPFTWEAVEPERGTYDTQFLDRYERMCELCGERGLRVIVDLHQDVFARPYCGDGFPLWACPAPVPEPPEDCSDWFMSYLSGETDSATAFDRFWSNADGLRDDLQAMWAEVAGRMWDVDAVIGFEILNEPHRGNADESTWAETVLPAFYEELGGVIRAAAPGALVFFDSTGVDAVNASTRVERPTGEHFVFAPHYYSISAFVEGFDHDPDAVFGGLGRWAGYRASWNLPVLIGEFGIKPTADESNVYYRAHWDALDAHLLHATLWEYSSTTDDWNDEAMSIFSPDGVETVGVTEAVRAYPRAVAGELVSFSYDAETRAGELVFEARADGITELAAPERLYPDGVAAEVTGVDGCATVEGGVLYVITATAGSATVFFEPS